MYQLVVKATAGRPEVTIKYDTIDQCLDFLITSNLLEKEECFNLRYDASTKETLLTKIGARDPFASITRLWEVFDE